MREGPESNPPRTSSPLAGPRVGQTWSVWLGLLPTGQPYLASWILCSYSNNAGSCIRAKLGHTRFQLNNSFVTCINGLASPFTYQLHEILISNYMLHFIRL